MPPVVARSFGSPGRRFEAQHGAILQNVTGGPLGQPANALSFKERAHGSLSHRMKIRVAKHRGGVRNSEIFSRSPPPSRLMVSIRASQFEFF